MAISVLPSPRMKLHRSMDPMSPSEPSLFDRRQSTVTCSSSSTTSSSSPELTADTTESIVTPSSDDEDDISPTVKPKIEELEDSFSTLDVLKEAKPAIVTLPQPKKRGRPRKHPIVEQKKTSHARSKTGCGTCRKRKKKCDETKPSCMNCEKNNVVCDGYEPKQQWRSGKQKLLQVMHQAALNSPPAQPLPLLVNGVDGPVDQMFFFYFTHQLGKVLSLTDNKNPFIDLILPMAKSHVGLMHSLLYLSSSCLLSSNGDHPGDWEERQSHHRSKAMLLLKDDLDTLANPPSATSSAVRRIGDPSIAQSLILCLQTVCSGDLSGSYRLHLNAMKEMLTAANGLFPDEELRPFLLEFLLYHDYSSSITSLVNPLDHRSYALMQDFEMPGFMIQPQAGTLLGVLDGLFGYISRIRNLRDQIRQYRQQGLSFHANHNIEAEAFVLDELLRNWEPSFPAHTPRWYASMLYQQCTWLYLARTTSASQGISAFRQAVETGLSYLRMLPWESDGPMQNGAMQNKGSSMQSILLMPLFLLGCAAFEPQQRPEISQAFERLQEWSKLGNIKYAREIVEEVWDMMDTGREEEAWDWEMIIHNRGWDFLVT